MVYHSRCVARGLQQTLLIAAFLGRTRLIDNLEFEIP